MRVFLIVLLILRSLTLSVGAAELQAPEVPRSGHEIMPESDSFGDALWQMLRAALDRAAPELREALVVSTAVLGAVILVSFVQALSEDTATLCEQIGSISIAALLMTNANAMIRLGTETVTEISEYGKLLLPVMTAALAAQGGLTSSASLYAGTAVFTTVLNSLLSSVLLPLVYLFLALALGLGMTGASLLKGFRDTLKTLMSWCLKTVLTVFTTYMSITGVISGTTDAAALKATKVTIASFVPVVGGILSDASEAVLVSAGLAKNAAGIYGICAILAVFLVPFLRIGSHYLVLKSITVISGIFGCKRIPDLIADFSTAMGLLLAMTGSACLLQLISTVCFLKGVG